MPEYRLADDGSRRYPKRGEPPIPTDGYYPDPGDPYILRPPMAPCKFRVRQEVTRQCCPNQPIIYFACQHGMAVSYDKCNQCIKSGKRDSLIQVSVA